MLHVTTFPDLSISLDDYSVIIIERTDYTTTKKIKPWVTWVENTEKYVLSHFPSVPFYVLFKFAHKEKSKNHKNVFTLG